MALLQSFNDDKTPKAKRRKLEHGEFSQKAQSPQPDAKANEDEDVDRVEDAEEDAAIGVDEQPEDDSDDEQDSTDPFDVHFACPDDDVVTKRIRTAKEGGWTTRRALMQSWRATVTQPDASAGPNIPKPLSGLDDLRLKHKLKDIAGRKIANFSKVHQDFSPLLFDYRDILFCDRTMKNLDSLRHLTCLHALNHIFK